MCFNWSHCFFAETQTIEIENLRMELSLQSTVVEGIYVCNCNYVEGHDSLALLDSLS